MTIDTSKPGWVERLEAEYLAEAPTPITRERFEEMFEALPPMAWGTAGRTFESFLFAEFRCGDVTDQFARVTVNGADHYFSKPVAAHRRDTWMTPAQLREICS